ncbi:hypothetical protein L1987_48704 [Smallanthus sonchifolius]|uniref:Uncharacterized protein n=1 Tax=Smallanthus sonchifolius TaxID=185202 RepID=A0ACB9FTK5_9ASTR|nr:hypothetical protein L1987_48704 [Smallanthus sonchifolius]
MKATFVHNVHYASRVDEDKTNIVISKASKWAPVRLRVPERVESRSIASIIAGVQMKRVGTRCEACVVGTIWWTLGRGLLPYSSMSPSRVSSYPVRVTRVGEAGVCGLNDVYSWGDRCAAMCWVKEENGLVMEGGWIGVLVGDEIGRVQERRGEVIKFSSPEISSTW